MQKFQILGTGCPACNKLAALVSRAADELELEIELEKISSIDAILQFDVAAMPALVVDGEIRAAGRVPSLVEIKKLMMH